MRRQRLLGLGLVLIGFLLFAVPSPQSTVCAQSIVGQATVCAPSQSYIDSITFAKSVTIAPIGNPVYLSSPYQGELDAYYFLASGATVSSASAAYCFTSLYGASKTCSPSTPLTVGYGANSAGVKYLVAQSPTMQPGNIYYYSFTMRDSAGTISSQKGGLIPTAASAVFTASASTLNATYQLAGTGAVAGFNAYAGEGVVFQVGVSQAQAPITSIVLSVSPGQSYTMTQYGTTLGGTWQDILNFASVGSYTVSAVINYQGGAQQNAFSVRVTTLTQRSASASSITFTPTSYTITDTGCFTGTAATSTVISGTQTTTVTSTGSTCSQVTDVCGASGCVGTTVVSSSGGTTTMVTTSSQTTTTVGQALGGYQFGVTQVSGFLFIFVGGFLALRRRR